MRAFDFISLKLAVFLIFGIVLGYYFPVRPILAFAMLLFGLLALGLLISKQKRDSFPLFGIITVITGVALGVFVVSIANPLTSSIHYSKNLDAHNQVWQVKVLEVLKPTSFLERYVAEVSRIDSLNGDGKILLAFSPDSSKPNLKVDDEIIFLGEAQKIHPPLNPHQFNYQDYLEKQGVYHQVRLEKEHLIFSENPSNTLVGIASNFREKLIENLKIHEFDRSELGVIQALLLGKRDDISEATYNDYRNAGAVHILAVSGLHVGILLLILQFVLQPLERLPRGKQLKIFTIILLLWVFAFITGLSPSIVRAVTMFSFLAYGMNLNRPTNTFNIIALSLFFILLVKPMFLFQVGFQMSYAAVIAIVWLYPKLQRLWYPKNLFVRKVWQLLSVSVAAQLGVLPLSLFYFHQFPALFFISNLIVVPFLGLILGTGILVVLLAALNLLPEFLVVAYNAIIKAMNSIVGWIADQEHFLFKDISFDGVQLVLGYLIIFSLLVTWSKTKFKNVAVLCASIICFTGWLIYQELRTSNEQTLILAHQTRNSILVHQNGTTLKVLAYDFESPKKIIKDYSVAERTKVIEFDTLKNSYALGSTSIFVMDSSGVYPTQLKTDHLILTQSPKINLERVIDSIQPQMIIADGSNYRSYVERWKKTCAKRKLPLHYTGEKGAFYFSISPKD